MTRYLATCAVLALAACAPKPAEQAKTEPAAAVAPAAAAAADPLAQGITVPPNTAPPGTYAIDGSHTNLSFRVSHLGFSRYTADFDKVDGKLQFDPANPSAMTVEATIDPKSLDLNSPPAGFHDELLGKAWLDATAFPAITFKSTKVEPAGDHRYKLHGDLTMHGVTKPVVLDVEATQQVKGMRGETRAGARATTKVNRKDFGINWSKTMDGGGVVVGDDVDVTIEVEGVKK